MASENVRILVVDDNPASRYATSRVLRSSQWTVLEAASGEEALAIIDPTVDLVVLDVNLPDIDGFEICRRIRRSETLSRVPVIHLSATFVTDGDKVRGLDVGADGYLVHPVEPPVLTATVRAFLRARYAERELESLLVRERVARSDADRANRIKDDFLATLSHELRTPLHAIIGWTELLKLGALNAEETAEAISVIERNAKVQAQMIADLMDISSITTGKLRLHVKLVDPAAMVEAALLAISPAAKAKNIKVVKHLEPVAQEISADPDRLQQVLWNLVNNAVKFTPVEGRIDVGMRKLASGIEITVADTGQGIDPGLLPVMFDRFQQGDASSTRKHGGLGIGLAIAKQLVDLHGGRIEAESAGKGLGAKFTVTLPLSPPLPGVAIPASKKEEQPRNLQLHDVRVLLVDDERDAREMLTRILQNRGAKVEAFDGMLHAMQGIAAFGPHVVLSDLGMPEHDGFELIRKIRDMGFTSEKLPAIALSGFAREEDRDRALQAGFQAHVAKPVDPPELINAIAALLSL